MNTCTYRIQTENNLYVKNIYLNSDKKINGRHVVHRKTK